MKNKKELNEMNVDELKVLKSELVHELRNVGYHILRLNDGYFFLDTHDDNYLHTVIDSMGGYPATVKVSIIGDEYIFEDDIHDKKHLSSCLSEFRKKDNLNSSISYFVSMFPVD